MIILIRALALLVLLLIASAPLALAGGPCLSSPPSGYSSVFCSVFIHHDGGNFATQSKSIRNAILFGAKKINPTNPTGATPMRIGTDNVFLNIDIVNIGSNGSAAISTIAQQIAENRYKGLSYVPHALILPHSSGSTAAFAAGVARSSNPNILQLTAGSSGDSVFIDTAGRRKFPTLFSVLYPASSSLSDLMSLWKLQGVSRISIVYEEEPYSLSSSVGMGISSDDLHLTVQQYTAGLSNSLTDAGAAMIAQQIFENNPDAVALPINSITVCQKLVRAFRALKFPMKAVVFGSCGASVSQLSTITDNDYRFMAVNTGWSSTCSGSDYDDSLFFQATRRNSTTHGETSPERFYREFQAQYNYAPSRLEASGMAVAETIALTVNGLNTTAEIDSIDKLLFGIRKVYAGSFYGRLTFNEFGQLVQRGAVVEQYSASSSPFVITPLSSAGMKLIYPFPTNILLPGENLPFSLSSSLVVLAFIFSVLGAWTTSILLETAIFHRKLREKKPFILFAGLSALALTMCSIWATAVILAAGMEFSSYVDSYSTPIDLSHSFSANYIFSSFLPLFTLIFISFVCQLYSIIPRDAQRSGGAGGGKLYELDSGHQNTNTTGTSGTGNSRTSQKTNTIVSIHTLNGPEGGNSNDGGMKVSRGEKSGKKSAKKFSRANFISEILYQLNLFYESSMKRPSPLSIMASFFFFGSFIQFFSMIYYSIQFPAQIGFSMPSGTILLLISFYWISCLFVLNGLFHYYSHRVPLSFLLGTMEFLFFYFGISAITFSYQPLTGPSSSDSPSILPGNLILVASVLGAVLVFILLGFQFSAMKLSRNHLDAILAKMNRRLEASDKRVDSLNCVLEQLENHIEKKEKQVVNAQNIIRGMVFLTPQCRVDSSISWLHQSSHSGQHLTGVGTKMKEKLLSAAEKAAATSGSAWIKTSVNKNNGASQSRPAEESIKADPLRLDDPVLPNVMPLLTDEESPQAIGEPSPPHGHTAATRSGTPQPGAQGTPILTPAREGSPKRSYQRPSITQRLPLLTDAAGFLFPANDLSESSMATFLRILKGQSDKSAMTLGNAAISATPQMAPVNEATSSHRSPSGPAPALLQILYHPLTLQLFKNFLSREMSLENLLCWFNIENWKNYQDLSIQIYYAKKIMMEFLCVGAEHEINVSDSQRKSAIGLIEEFAQTGPNGSAPGIIVGSNGFSFQSMFDAIERELLALMERDSYARYQLTEEYRVSLWILENLPVSGILNSDSTPPTGYVGISHGKSRSLKNQAELSAMIAQKETELSLK